MTVNNYFGWNTPQVLAEKAEIERALTRIARSEGLYDNEGGWSDHSLEQLSHELHYAGFDDEGAFRAALIGYTNGVGSGVGAANHWRETGAEPDRQR